MRPLLEAAGRLLGRGVAPAVLVALSVSRTGQVRELVREGALAELLAPRSEPEPLTVRVEITVVAEPHQEATDEWLGNRQEARELWHGGPPGEAFRSHPVHRLQNLVADPKGLELIHRRFPRRWRTPHSRRWPTGLGRWRRSPGSPGRRGRNRAAPPRRAPPRAASRRRGPPRRSPARAFARTPRRRRAPCRREPCSRSGERGRGRGRGQAPPSDDRSRGTCSTARRS